jgi:hypothetical protein
MRVENIFWEAKLNNLTSETVESTALSLESVDDIQGSNSLALGVFSVGDGITDDVLKEDLQDTTGFLIDETRDTLDTTTTSETTDSRLGNTLNVVTKNLAMTLGTSLSESFSTFAATSHIDIRFMSVMKKWEIPLRQTLLIYLEVLG